MKISSKVLFYVSLLLVVIYCAALSLISFFYGGDFNDINLDLKSSIMLQIIALITGLSINFLPGLLFLQNKDSFSIIIVKSFIVSTIILNIGFALLKILGIQITRIWLIIVYFLFVSMAYTTRMNNSFSVTKTDIKNIKIALIFTLAALLILFPKIFYENFSGDGIEVFEFSNSLKNNLTPYWDLENSKFGFYPRFMFFAYPNLVSILIMGNTESSVRFPALIYFFLILLAIYEIIKQNKVIVGLGVALILIFNAFYSTWHPFFADISSPTLLEFMVGFYIIFAFYNILNKNLNWFLLSSVIALLTFPNGLFFIVAFGLTAYFILNKKYMTKYLIFFGFITMTYYVIYSLFGFGKTDYTFNYFIPFGLQLSRILSLKYFLLMTGIIPIFLTKKKISKALFALSISYFIIMLLANKFNTHYFVPMALITMLSFGLELKNYKLSYIYGFMVIAILFLIIPFNYQINLDVQKIGNRTCIDATNYEESVVLSQSVYNYLPFKDYGVGHHTLLFYASDKCNKEYDFVLTNNKLDGYIEYENFKVLKSVDRPQIDNKRYCRPILMEICERWDNI